MNISIRTVILFGIICFIMMMIANYVFLMRIKRIKYSSKIQSQKDYKVILNQLSDHISSDKKADLFITLMTNSLILTSKIYHNRNDYHDKQQEHHFSKVITDEAIKKAFILDAKYK